MSDTVIGPIRSIAGPGGVEAPFYVLPFDKRGLCMGPRTLELLLEEVSAFTDVYLFSHGWNNDWQGAMRAYDGFIQHFLDLRAEHWPCPERDYRPLLVGIVWPSAALVAPWEHGPSIAASMPAGVSAQWKQDCILDIGADLTASEASDLYEWMDRDSLTYEQALGVARSLISVLGGDRDDLTVPAGSPEELVEAWRKAPDFEEGDPKNRTSQPLGGRIPEEEEERTDRVPAAAGLSDFFDPRQIVRLATVLLMKDRAGTVGSTGVSDLLLGLRTATRDARTHLIGHSYGCKVLLSALCAPDESCQLTVDSILLLQPAISCYCFAAAGSVPGIPGPGGYSHAPERSTQPIVCTYSCNDVPLTQFFHWAARRGSDIGENRIGGLPPSRYAALGGYGPQGIAATILDAVSPPAVYALPSNSPVVGIRADGVIGEHGQVSTPATAWMLLNQTMST